MGYPVQQSTTAQPLVFFMADSADHVTGKTGLSPTVTLSKNGAAFAAPSGAVSEIGNGFYKVAGNATDNATLGPLALYATSAGADPCKDMFSVVSFNPQDGVRLGLTALPNAAAGANAGLPVLSSSATTLAYTVSTVTTVTNQLTAAQIATGVWQDSTAGDFTTASSIGKSLYTSGVAPGASGGLFIAGSNAATTVNFTGNLSGSVGSVTASVTVGTNNDKTGYALSGTQTFNNTGTWTGNLSGSVGSVTGLTVANLDVAVSTRMATYTQPTGFLAATFPATIASPTNITAGTLTTVTNLTNLPAITTDWITAAGLSAAAVTKIQTGLSTYSGSDTTGTTTLLDRLTSGRAINLDNLDVVVSSRMAAFALPSNFAIMSINGSGQVTIPTSSVVGSVTGAVGSVTAPISVASNFKKNQALSSFEFLMTDSVNHAPALNKIVTATRSIDGADFDAGTLSAVTEVGNGIYKVDFAAADMNGNVITLRATANGADDTFERILTQP